MEAVARSAMGNADQAKFAGAIFAAGHAMIHAMIMARGTVEFFAMDQGERAAARSVALGLNLIQFRSNRNGGSGLAP